MPISLSNLRAALLPGLLQATTSHPGTNISQTRDLLLPAIRALSGRLKIQMDLQSDFATDSIHLIFQIGPKHHIVPNFLTRHDIETGNYKLNFSERVCSALGLPTEDEPSTALEPTFSLNELEQAQALIDELKCK